MSGSRYTITQVNAPHNDRQIAGNCFFVFGRSRWAQDVTEWTDWIRNRGGMVTTDLRDPALNYILDIGIKDGHTYRDIKPFRSSHDRLPDKHNVAHRACVLWRNGQKVQDQPGVRVVTRRWMLEADRGQGYVDCKVQGVMLANLFRPTVNNAASAHRSARAPPMNPTLPRFQLPTRFPLPSLPIAGPSALPDQPLPGTDAFLDHSLTGLNLIGVPGLNLGEPAGAAQIWDIGMDLGLADALRSQADGVEREVATAMGFAPSLTGRGDMSMDRSGEGQEFSDDSSHVFTKVDGTPLWVVVPFNDNWTEETKELWGTLLEALEQGGACTVPFVNAADILIIVGTQNSIDPNTYLLPGEETRPDIVTLNHTWVRDSWGRRRLQPYDPYLVTAAAST